MIFSPSFYLLFHIALQCMLARASSSFEASSLVKLDCHSSHLDERRGCSSLPVGHALLMANFLGPQAIDTLQVELELSQENCSISTVTLFSDIGRILMIESWGVESAKLPELSSPEADSNILRTLSVYFHLKTRLSTDALFVEVSCGVIKALSFAASNTDPAFSPPEQESIDLHHGIVILNEFPGLPMMDMSTPLFSFCDPFNISGTCSVVLCEGDSVVFSGCEANGGSCFGDTVFHLMDPDSVLVANGDGECGLCSEISFTSTTAGCSVFTLVEKCWTNSQECGGTTAVVAPRAANILNISATSKFNCSEQYAALEDLYYSTNGDDWHFRSKWLNGDPTFEGWHGIEAICYDGAACCQVIQCTLRHNNLVGGWLKAVFSECYSECVVLQLLCLVPFLHLAYHHHGTFFRLPNNCSFACMHILRHVTIFMGSFHFPFFYCAQSQCIEW